MKNTYDEKLEKVLDKVKKLFALAGNNPSEAEAQAAAMRAQELIAKYNLTITDEDEKLEITKSSFVTGVDKSWKYNLASVIENNFRVKSYWIDKRKVVFYGYKQDTEVAKEVFQYLFRVCEKNARRECRKSYQIRGTEKGVYFSYTRGFIIGIGQKLSEQCVALRVVTPPEVNDQWEDFKVQQNMRTLGKVSRNGSDGFRRGVYEQGIVDGRLAMNERRLEDRH
jgi:hypothetical protein